MSNSANGFCSDICSPPLDRSYCRSARSDVLTVADRPEKVTRVFYSSVRQGLYSPESAKPLKGGKFERL